MFEIPRIDNNIQAAFLSFFLLLPFFIFWHMTTPPSVEKVEAVSLSSSQIEKLANQGMSEVDIKYYAGKGLKADQIGQIAGLGLSREELDAAGGIAAFGFTTSTGKAE